MNTINSASMPAIKYQGPAQRFQLVNREDQACLVDDKTSGLYFGSSPVSVEELSLAGFSTMRKLNLPQELNAELPAGEVSKSMPGPQGGMSSVLQNSNGLLAWEP